MEAWRGKLKPDLNEIIGEKIVWAPYICCKYAMCNVLWIILYICLQSFMFTNFHVMASIVFSAAWFVSALWHLSVINTTLNFSFFFYSPLQRNQTVRPPTAVEMRGRERRPEIGWGRASVGPAAESQPRSTAGLCGISDLCSVLSGAADNLHVELGTRNLWTGLILKDHSCFFSIFYVYSRRFIMKLYLHSLIFYVWWKQTLVKNFDYCNEHA